MAVKGEQTKQQGYTAPEFAVRCPRCSVLLAAQRVTGQMESGGSMLVATMARCINLGQWREDRHKTPKCGKIYNLQLTEEAMNLGLVKSRVLNCVKDSEGNHFTLKELQQGHIDFVDTPKTQQSFEEVMNPPQNYNPDQFTEQEDVF